MKHLLLKHLVLFFFGKNAITFANSVTNPHIAVLLFRYSLD